MTRDFIFGENEKVLELDSRRKIYEVVKKYAGCHFREIERKSGMPSGTAKYHLSYLTRHGLINEEKSENKIRYFPTSFKSENKILLGLLRQSKSREIILFLLVHPGGNHDEIAKAVNVSSSTASWHLKKLKEGNVIKFVKKGRMTFYKIIEKDEIMGLLIAYQESFLDSIVDRVIEMWDLEKKE